MIYSIKITQKAKNDIINIFEYIMFKLCAPQAAANLVDKIESAIRSLDTMPFRFVKYSSKTPELSETRIMNVDNYLVFYIPNKDEEVVNVIRVIYGGRDIDEVLGNK